MKERAIKDIRKFCLDCGYEFTDNYSGRFMYGKLCVGIIGNFIPSDFIKVLSGIIDFSITGEPKVDTMGLGYIVYFENLQYEKSRLQLIEEVLDSDISQDVRTLLEKKDVVYSREYATTPDMNCPSCNKTLLTNYPKFCSECGTRLHYRNDEENY